MTEVAEGAMVNPGDDVGSADRGACVTEAGADAMFEELYEIIRGIARRASGTFLGDAIIQPTMVVHEAYLKIASSHGERSFTRTHMLALAARALRHFLATHARSAAAQKRGGGRRVLCLLEGDTPAGDESYDALEVEEGLISLAAEHPRSANVFEARVYGGMTASESAAWLGVSRRTAELDYRYACAFLREFIGRRCRA